MKPGNLVHDGNGWKTISTESHFANSHLQVVTDCVKTPSRDEPRPWATVHRKPAVVIAPMTADGKIVLIRQERVPIRTAIWEVPAGQIDDAREPDQGAIEAAALRELHEETGFELAPNGKLVALGHYFSSPGFTDEHGYFFLACPVVPSVTHVKEEAESILEVRSFAVPEFVRMIADNEIRDANTLSMAARLAANGYLSLKSC